MSSSLEIDKDQIKNQMERVHQQPEDRPKPKKKSKAAKKESPVEQIPVENQSFEDQQNIRKVLLTEAGADSASEYESDVEDALQD